MSLRVESVSKNIIKKALDNISITFEKKRFMGS